MRTIAKLAALLATAVACDADLESSCRDGTCGGGLAPNDDPPLTCETERGLPTEVCSVLERNCHRCHAGEGPGPFPLLYYCDTQAPYSADKARWEQMRIVTNKSPDDPPPRMPLDDFPMDPDDLEILNAWFDTCDAGECEKGAGPTCGTEGGGGAGGEDVGGAGGADVGGGALGGGGGAGGAPAGGAGGAG